MNSLIMPAKWVLVFSGLFWAYEGLTGSDLVEVIFGTMEPVVDIVIFGGAAVILGYHLSTMKSKKK